AGTNLHGSNAANNLSLRGWAEAHQVAAGWGVLAAGVVLTVLAARLAVPLWRRDPPSPVWLGNLAMIGALLGGGISEVHYMLVVVAAVLLQVAVRPDRRTVVPLLPALLL